MNKIESNKLENLVIAIDPQTDRPRVFYKAGQTAGELGMPKLDLYRAFEGVSKDYTMRDLKWATYARNMPVVLYNQSRVEYREPSEQGQLFK